MNIEECIIEFKKMIEIDKDTLRYWKSDTFGHYEEPIKTKEKDILISETLLTAYEKEKEKNKELEKKDKIIDKIVNAIVCDKKILSLMCKRIINKTDEECDVQNLLCDDCIKKHFKNLVEKENK